MASLRISSSSPFPALCLVFGLLLCSGCSRESLDFAKLRSYRRETPVATNLAVKLKESSRGVDLAVADMDCFGGQTRGWSSWILEQSSLADYVERKLTRTCGDHNESLTRRIEAARI